jgi:asparagine synthase (glutamine-hydrolysing)
MSQFFGFIALNSPINVSEWASQMTDGMSFFQEDTIGIFETNEIFICNKYLFNTPESVKNTGIYQNERYVLAASCRIDNREELTSKVSIKNSSVASDHEYILAAYEYFQEKCVDHLIGDFSFVVWDKVEKTLFMAKDHMGVKPAFYTLQNDVLYFATDLNAFLKIDKLNIDYSKAYLSSMLFEEIIETEVSPEFTCYEHIFRLKPAHCLTFKNNELRLKEYWRLTPQKKLTLNSNEEYYKMFFDLVEQAIACRLRTFNNVGVELSGGLDSSAIACMIGHISKKEQLDLKNIYTVSLVHSEVSREFKPYEDEEPLQKIVQEWIGIDSENIVKNSVHPFHSFWDEYDYGFNVHGGFSKVNFTWQKPIYESLQCKNCAVKLSGFAGDEIVSNSGVHWYYDALYSFDLLFIGKFLSKNTYSHLKKTIRYYLNRFSILKITLKATFDTNYVSPPFKNTILKKTHKRSHINHPSFLSSLISRPFTSLRFETEALHALRHRVECRYPLADIRLLEFILTTPYTLFEPYPIKRMFFRNSLQSILPSEIFQRDNKAGAVLPYMQEKNSLFFAELKELKEINETTENSFINTRKIKNKISDLSKLRREIEITSLLNAIFLKNKLSNLLSK